MIEIREYLTRKKLVFDGAMGTYYAKVSGRQIVKTELACLYDADTVERIHREYIDAGARAIKTNTFGANSAALESVELVGEVIDAAWDIAERSVAGNNKVMIFADIGAIPPENASEYIDISRRFLLRGATHFLFETLSSPVGIPEACRYIKSKCPEAFIIVSFAADSDGFTHCGEQASTLLESMADDDNIDAVGLNCINGPYHMLQRVKALPKLKKPLSIMPNSGYPSLEGSRMYFPYGVEYFTEQMGEIARSAAILGGCCGTTPEYIRAIFHSISRKAHESELFDSGAHTVAVASNWRNDFYKKLKGGKRVVAVELDPPEDADITKFMAGAKLLTDVGVDAITIADCPIARVRADSSMLAVKLRRELGIDVIPHMTCRDRNLNAIKALLLGLGIEGVSNVLTVTGDQIPSCDRDTVKGVFNFNSQILAHYINELNELTGRPINVCGALNVNAPNFEPELSKALRKQEAGVTVFFTQAIYTDEAIANLELARETLSANIMGGILPIVSHRNARFMHNEIAGITLSPELIARYEGLDRDAAQRLAIEISVDTAKRIKRFTDGFYIMTPFGRASLVVEIVEKLRSDGVV